MSRVRTLAVVVAAVVVGSPLADQAWAAPPAPVTDLQLSSSNGLVYVSWTASTDTDAANVCWAPGSTPPASPTATGVTCSGVLTTTGYNFSGTAGQQYGVSVFSYDTNSQQYGDPASGTVTVVASPPRPPIQLVSEGFSGEGDLSHMVQLAWTDSPANPDTQDYLVAWSIGLNTPPLVDDANHETTETYFDIGKLRRNVVYTFAVRSRDIEGRVSDPAILHASTRQPGFALIDNKHAGNKRVRSTPEQIYQAGNGGAATMTPDGHLRTAFGSAYFDEIFYVSRASAASGWSRFKTFQYMTHPNPSVFIDATPNGRVVIAGSDRSGPWFVHRVNYNWSNQVERPTHAARDHVVGVTGDRSGFEHLLIHRVSPNGGLFYLTRHGAGEWATKRVPGTTASDIGLLARDPVTNSVVLVDGHRSSRGTTIRYAVLAPTASKAASLRPWLSSGPSVGWTPTSVTSNSGRITLAVQRSSANSALDGPYVMWARGARHHAPVRVRGTSAHDSDAVVTALQPGSVQLAFRRTSDAWDPSNMGVYVERWSGKPMKSGWSFSGPDQWTNSAYDFPVAAFRAADGHLYLTYRTSPTDVTE